ncbi:hypothetical protein [Aquimarina sediminis]|uniref:hypothetical protein n=1 Tax=Aquimarina sediminis TaxID=2070536 RepID=UPI000CA08B75|nr:hypothetical protein [Aquimarina sediminis]
MKTIIYVASLVLAFSFGNAQTSSNSKVTITHSSDKQGDKNYKINISISNTEEEYSLQAKFPHANTEKVKQFLKDHLDTKMIKENSMNVWKYTSNRKPGYTVKLKKGKLDIFINKQNISADMIETLIDMFTDIKEVIKE